jgi:alanine racemase
LILEPATWNLQLRSGAHAVIDLDAIASNFRLLRERVGSRRAFYAVLKADAYGHGAARVARRLEREGADRFAVASTGEGVALRRAGVAGEILLLSHAEPEDLARQRAYGLTPTLYDPDQADALARESRAFGEPLGVQLELDTGMGRAGMRPEQLDRVGRMLAASPWLRLTGTFANLSCADDPGRRETAQQIAGLVEAAAKLRAMGVEPGPLHAANSAGILAHPESWLDGVRPGLGLYGVDPAEGLSGGGLSPAMRVETRVIAVHQVGAGTPLGYGGRFVTQRPTTVAVLPIGYHDGFRRGFSSRAAVLLRGRRAPVVGSVSMDLTLVDATATGAARGDRAVCLGADGAESVTAWELARALDTIPYEILCGFGARVSRVFVERAAE